MLDEDQNSLSEDHSSKPNQNSQTNEDPSNLHTAGDKKKYYLDTSTFLTGVNQIEKGPKRLDEDLPKAKDINLYHHQLNGLVNDLGIKISDVIKGHENDFFIAFKNKMYAIMKEMRELKEKASSERHKAKQEARLVNLEKERDWFRREALKLDKICKDHKRILNKLKATLENVEEDRDFFQEQLFNAKKVNKALLMEVEKYKKAIGSLDNNSQMQIQYSQPLAITNEDMNRDKVSVSGIKNRVNAALAASDGLDKRGVEFDMDKDDQDDLDDQDFDDFKYRQDDYKPDYKAITGQSAQKNQMTSSLNRQTTGNDEQAQPLQGTTVSIEEYNRLLKENKELKDKESKYVDTVKHLKNQIDNEKKYARSLRADKVNFLTQRNELEEFFLQCIEEVRKDIVKRKTISSSYSNKRSGLRKSTSQATMARASQDSDAMQSAAAKLDNFTATDKRKVIELLMSNENVLLFLYEKLFPVSTLSQQSTQSRGQTAGYSQNVPPSGLQSQSQPYRFMTEGGIPAGGQNRSQTTVGGSRLHINKTSQEQSQQIPFVMSNEFGNTVQGAIQNAMPLTNQPHTTSNATQGMSIQNNIQNINLNINLAKTAYGSQPFIPQKVVRGATAPLGAQRQKRSYQTQLNAVVGNKYQII